MRSVLAIATGGDNPIPKLARRMANSLYEPVHLSHMVAVLASVLEDILTSEHLDIDHDVWSCP